MQHENIQRIADGLFQANLASLIFNFPFTEAGRKRVDGTAVSVATLISAVAEARRLVPDLLIALGGHSYGGRMASHAVLSPEFDSACGQIQGLVFCSFPLHPAGKPGTDRAGHLKDIALPMLFLSGTRDALAQPELLQGEVSRLGDNSRLHWLDTADHGYRVLKRSRKQELDVFSEIARETAAFLAP